MEPVTNTVISIIYRLLQIILVMACLWGGVSVVNLYWLRKSKGKMLINLLSLVAAVAIIVLVARLLFQF